MRQVLYVMSNIPWGLQILTESLSRIIPIVLPLIQFTYKNGSFICRGALQRKTYALSRHSYLTPRLGESTFDNKK